MREINVWRDPYAEGFATTRLKTITIDDGVTVLVGCNGIGKTTLLKNIKSELKENKVPFMWFDNLTEGGSDSIGKSVWHNDIGAAATKLCSSEGENININLCEFIPHWPKFFRSGKNTFNAYGSDLGPEEIKTKERWILMDAVDSGLSVDQVIETKNILKFACNDAREAGFEPYIIISANEYELASGMNCFDVANGRYKSFKDYEDYKKFILKTAETKSKRYK